MSNPISITDPTYGADPKKEDNREAIQKALNQKGAVYCPEGTFRVAGTLSLLSDTRFFGPGTLHLTAPDNVALLLIHQQQNVTVQDISLQGNQVPGADTIVSLLDIRGGASNTFLENLTLTNAGNFGIGAADSDYVRVSRCRITNFLERGINLTFCDHVTLVNNELDGELDGGKLAQHGIEIWGKYYEKMDAAHYVVANNSVRNVSGGGIWCAWTRDITIIGNYTENCHDVGIDVEGSEQAVITGNTVKNGKNAGISAFFASQDVLIQANEVTQEAGFGPGVRIFGKGVSRHLRITHNVIRTNNSAGVAADQHVLSDSEITANHIITKQGLGILLLEANRVNVLDNALLLNDTSKGIAVEGGSNCVIRGNHITKSSRTAELDPVRQGGIYLYWRSPEFPCLDNQVTGNIVLGFVVAINDNCWGAESTNVIVNNRAATVYHRQATPLSHQRIAGNMHQGKPAKVLTY